MVALQIEDIRGFMSGLLVKNIFDKFYLCDGEIETLTSFRIGGRLNKGYFTGEEQDGLGERENVLWSEVKPLAYQIVRGHKLPLSMKFVLALSAENTQWLIEHNHLNVSYSDIAGLFLNIRYENQKITCITGTSFKTFIMDKTLEQVWDDTVIKFMRQNDIAAEQM